MAQKGKRSWIAVREGSSQSVSGGSGIAVMASSYQSTVIIRSGRLSRNLSRTLLTYRSMLLDRNALGDS